MSQTHTSIRYLALALATLFVAGTAQAQWLSRPAPSMPPKIFREAYTGSVAVRIILNQDGTVRTARLISSSSHGDLDDLALATVMKWRLDPKEVRPSDLTEGRGQIVGFRQNGTPPRALTPDEHAYWALIR